MLHGWDRLDLQTGSFSWLDVMNFSQQFQVLRTLTNPSHGFGWDRQDLQTGNFRWAWWCQYSQPVYLGLINTTSFFQELLFWMCSNHIYCDLAGPFLESAFSPCYLGCGFNRLCLGNFLGGEVSPHLNPFIIVGVISCLDILLHCLTFGRFTSVPPVFSDHLFHYLIVTSRVVHFFCYLVW